MPCKHLLRYSHSRQIWTVASCSAKNTPYVPSLRELESYCQSGRHTVCPAYLVSFENGGQAPEGSIPAEIGKLHLTSVHPETRLFR